MKKVFFLTLTLIVALVVLLAIIFTRPHTSSETLSEFDSSLELLTQIEFTEISYAELEYGEDSEADELNEQKISQDLKEIEDSLLVLEDLNFE